MLRRGDAPLWRLWNAFQSEVIGSAPLSPTFPLHSSRLGSLTLPAAKSASQATPELAESKPEMIVSVRGVRARSDQPAIAVEKLQTRISVARSVVETRPRRSSGTRRISKVS